MVLGVGTYSGSSMSDFMTGAIAGTAYVIITGKGANFTIGLAVPVGLLMVQLDVLARFINTYFLHCVDEYIEADDVPKVACNVVCGVFLGDYLAQFRSLVAICYWLLGKEK